MRTSHNNIMVYAVSDLLCYSDSEVANSHHTEARLQ